jgi:predicted amidophosphoribosyltransferase
MNPDDAQRCMRCGAILVRQCPACHHDNPPEAEYCGNCGEALDALAFVFHRYAQASEHSASMRAEVFGAAKKVDQEYMREQRARLDAEERERMAKLEIVHAEAKRQQKVVIAVGVAITILALLALAALAFLQASAGGM